MMYFTGYCGCALKDVQVEACNDIGQVVVPNPTGMCSIFLNSPILATFNTYVSWKDLALTSCALLDTSRTLCFQVDVSGGMQRISAPTIVVGFEFLNNRRRRSLLSFRNDSTSHATLVEDGADEQQARVHYMLWNATWSSSDELCSALVYAYRRHIHIVSFTDRAHLKQCLHWRVVGNSTLEKYVLLNSEHASTKVNDEFLLSYQALSMAIQDPVFTTNMLKNFPASILYMASFTEWAKPVVQAAHVLDDFMQHIWHLLPNFLLQKMTNNANRTFDMFENETLNNLTKQQLKHIDRAKRMLNLHLLPFMHAGLSMLDFHTSYAYNISKHIDSILYEMPPFTIVSNTILPLNTTILPSNLTISNHLRHMLQFTANANTSNEDYLNLTTLQESTWKDEIASIASNSMYTSEIQMVQAYSALIAVGAHKTAMLSSDFANRWREGPFLWPVSIVEDREISKEDDFYYCPSGESAAHVIVSAFVSLQQQLTLNSLSTPNAQPATTTPSSSARVSTSFPKIHKGSNMSLLNKSKNIQLPLGPFGHFELDSSENTWVREVLLYTLGFLTGNSSEPDGGYTASKLLREYFVCSFDEVIMKCQRKRTSLVAGTVSILLLLALYCVAFGASAPIFLSFISITAMILWHVYGYSPACLPMIPPCIVEDVAHILQWLIPLQMQWPNALENIPGCAYNVSVPVDSCFVSCKDPPFEYGAPHPHQGWEASVAWLLCDWDPVWCSTAVPSWLQRNIQSTTIIPTTFYRMLEQKSSILSYKLSSVQVAHIDAQRFCCATHLVYLVPYIFVCILLVYTVYAIVYIPVILLQALLDFLLQAIVYIHMKAAVPRNE
jgi:hypothetical protein